MNIKKLFFLGLIASSLDVVAQQKIEVEDVVVMSLDRSFDVLLQKNTLESTERDFRNAKGLYLPDVTLNAGRNWTRQDSRQTLADNSERNVPGIRQNGFNSNIQVNWVLFDGLKMFNVNKAWTELYGAGEMTVKSQMANTMANVINNYFNIVAQKQRLKAINEQIAVSEERVKLADRRFEVGAAAKTELLQAKLDQNQFRTQALQQEALIAQLKADLNSIAGGQLPELYEVSDTIMLNLNLTIEEILEGIEATNPVLIAQRQTIEAAKYTFKASKGDRLPIISFTSAYNLNRNESNQAQNQFSPIATRTNGFNYGLTGTWFLVNNLTITNNIQKNRILVQRQELIYEQLKTLSINAVRSAYANYDNARKILLIEEENAQLSRENVSILLETFKRGATTFIELRTAQLSMVDAYNRLTNARYTAKVSETELLRQKGALLR